MSYRTLEQELAEAGLAVSYTVGDSMEPLLHDRRSTVAVSAPARALVRGDVALYRRPTGECVLHRVVRVGRDVYYIRGDNRIYTEKVPAGWVIGVLLGYYPDEGDSFVSCGSPEDLAYRRILPLRYARLWLRAFPGRAKRLLGRMLYR